MKKKIRLGEPVQYYKLKTCPFCKEKLEYKEDKYCNIVHSRQWVHPKSDTCYFNRHYTPVSISSPFEANKWNTRVK